MTNVSIENFKAACKRMGDELKNSGVTLKHQTILDIVARSFGYKDYNTYCGCHNKVTLPDGQKPLKKTNITFRFSGGHNMVEKIKKAWKMASERGKVGEPIKTNIPYVAPEYKVYEGKNYVNIEYHGDVSNIMTAFFDMDAIMYSIDKDMLAHIESIVKTVEVIYHENMLEVAKIMKKDKKQTVDGHTIKWVDNINF